MVEKKCTRLAVKPSIKESEICSIGTRKFKTPTTDVDPDLYDMFLGIDHSAH